MEMPGGVGERLSAKAGPLPVWGWAICIVGVIGAASYVRKKKAGSAADSTDTTDNNAVTVSGASPAVDETAGLIGADYDLRNSLELATSRESILASNVSTNTAATQANTAATVADTKADTKAATVKPKYAVVKYGRTAYELGPTAGTNITAAQVAKTKAKPEPGGQYVRFGSKVAKLNGGTPKYLTDEEFSKIKGHPRAVVVTPNTTVNVATSKVR